MTVNLTERSMVRLTVRQGVRRNKIRPICITLQKWDKSRKVAPDGYLEFYFTK